MAEFKSVLRLQKVSPEGKVLQEEEIDLRRGIVGKGDPTNETEGTVGFTYYDIYGIENGVVVQWECIDADENGTVWIPASGKPGKDGVSVTIISVEESQNDGGTNIVTFSDGNKLFVKNGSKGAPGKGLDIKGTYSTLDALDAAVTNPNQGDMYNVGTAAPYTIYMYDTEHGWVSQGQLQGANGTTFTPSVDKDGNLTWTNDGGLPNPTARNIKGTSVYIVGTSESKEDGGDNVITFSDGTKVTVKNGSKGGTGPAMTVENVYESEEDGGSNVITFSDGTKVTVKNGSKGTAGHTPEKGVDYFTAAEKADMVSAAAAAIPISNYVPKSGTTMTGALVAQSNTNYTVPQVRNIITVADGDTIPSTQNGDIVLIREA